MDRRQNTLSDSVDAAGRVAAARRCYQAVVTAWAQDLLLLRARGMLVPGVAAGSIHSCFMLQTPARAAIRATHAPSLRHAA